MKNTTNYKSKRRYQNNKKDNPEKNKTERDNKKDNEKDKNVIILRFKPILSNLYYEDRGEIYRIRNKINGDSYIGQTKCLKSRNGEMVYKGYQDRYQQHIKNAFNSKKINDCPKFYPAIRQFSPDVFEVSLLKRCLLSEINKWERYYIKVYKTRKYGYNIDRGGKPRPSKVKRLNRYRKR